MTVAAGKPRDRGLTVPDLIKLAGEHPELAIPLKEYFEALRAGDEKLREADKRFFDERDRRYAEVKAAEKEALKVKEVADERALRLQAETQQYKDEKANELREQISAERGSYVTQDQLQGAVARIEALIKPLSEYSVGTAGRDLGAASYRSERRLDYGTVLAAVAILVSLATVLVVAFKP